MSNTTPDRTSLGMKHVSSDTLHRFRARQLAPAEIIAVAEHLRACSACASADVTPEVAAFHESMREAEGDEAHIEPNRLIDYVDGDAGAAERELIQSHLDDCAMCSSEVLDLMRLTKKLSRARRLSLLGMSGLAAAAAIATLLFLRPMPRAPRVPEREIVRPPVIRTAPAPVDARPAQWQKAISDALRNGRLPQSPDLDALRPKPEVQRSAPAESKSGLSPAGAVVESTRPLFTWTARRGAAAIVTVFENGKRVAASGAIRGDKWRPSKNLARGATYHWQIEFRSGDDFEIVPAPPAAPALFKILSEDAASELARARSERPGDHVLLAVLYAQHGLEEEARLELRRAREAGQSEAQALSAPRR
jgi:hypothetical protein